MRNLVSTYSRLPRLHLPLRIREYYRMMSDASVVTASPPAHNPFIENGSKSPDGNHEKAASAHNGRDDNKKRKRDNNLGCGAKGFASKKRDMGRKDYERSHTDRRSRVEETRQRDGRGDVQADGAEKEERRPKHKVAVMIGYSGTGYKGMQVSPGLKTIEGDLFDAFVRAGAISKANADDPKKSSLVRCARTDKGVHAAGNMISLKLIIEDEDIVQRINKELSPQIRVWGLERTIGSFSCYQACDSRWYEYLIPSHAFLPPHPKSFLAKKLVAMADEVGDRAEYEARQKDVSTFWDEVDQAEIKPWLDDLDEALRHGVIGNLYKTTSEQFDIDDKDEKEMPDNGAEPPTETEPIPAQKPAEAEPGEDEADESLEAQPTDPTSTSTIKSENPRTVLRRRQNEVVKQLKHVYELAKRRYRIQKPRMDAIQRALDQFVGVHNFHNYTVQKPFKDPSAKRNIKSFNLDPSPVYIHPTTHEASDTDCDGATEWLSIKIHGQSFMMHQIRKMIGLATLLVRCGTDSATRVPQSYTDQKWAIPKVPGLGLLLERPVFENYNLHTAPKHDRRPIGFEKFETEIRQFKKREIYRRIFEEEAQENTFQLFFNHLDNYAQPTFLYVTSKGYEATLEPGHGPPKTGSAAAEGAKGEVAASAPAEE